MGIKKIKKENDTINISLIDLMGNLDTSDTKKYTQFLVKVLKKNYDEDIKYMIKDDSSSRRKIDEILGDDSFNSWLTKRLISQLYGWDEMNLFVDFCDYMERGLINEKDISKYDSWEMVASEVYQAKNRDLFKKAKKEVKVVYEDDQYTCIKPLTYEASVSYGYQTRWCTASVQEPSYFYNHSRDGVLVYLIDKINNVKFGFYHDQNQIQIYNQKDNRVDSMETDLPLELLHKLVSEMKSDAKDKNFNYKLFSESELEKMRKYRRDDHYPEIGPMNEMLTEGPMGLTGGHGPIGEMMVEEPTNEDIMIHTGLRNDIIEDMRERVHRFRPVNPIEIGDELP
jgi:hypothetical protein